MNGRCESDPLDIADDVCDSCGGEYCSSCLLQPKGRNHPVCRECAIALAGVRSKSKVVRKQSKADARKSRKRLRAVAAEPAERSGFMFFDSDPDFVTSGIDDPPPPVPSSEEVEAEEVKRQGGLLGRLRRKTDSPHDDQPPAPDSDALQVTLGGSGSDENDQQGLPSATELLARLKAREELGTDGTASPDDLAELDPNDIWLPPVIQSEDSWNLPGLEDDETASEDAVGGPNADGDPEHLQSEHQQSEHLQSEQLQPEPGGVDLPVETQEPPAPVAPPPTPPAPQPAAASFPSEMAPPVFVSEKELKAKGPADQDEHGDWVPPTLRGIVPKEQREATELPRRRR